MRDDTKIWRKLLALALGLALFALAPGCHRAKKKKKMPKRAAAPAGQMAAASAGPLPAKPTSALAAKEVGRPAGAVRWKAVIMTGDDSIPAFDNARKRIKEIWIARGLRAGDVRELSMTPAEQKGAVGASSAAGLRKALTSLAVKSGEGCLVYLTSHGAPWGFYLRGQPALSPAALGKMLGEACGEQPTIVLVSACFSGIFTGKAVAAKNRVVLTAARDDRSSFGCGIENEFTFWDACLIDQLPTAASARGLANALDSCIRSKERERHLSFSYPQASVGSAMTHAVLFDNPADAE